MGKTHSSINDPCIWHQNSNLFQCQLDVLISSRCKSIIIKKIWSFNKSEILRKYSIFSINVNYLPGTVLNENFTFIISTLTLCLVDAVVIPILQIRNWGSEKLTYLKSVIVKIKIQTYANPLLKRNCEIMCLKKEMRQNKELTLK